MEANLQVLIGKCVEKNIFFEGTAGSVWSVQDLMHNTSLKSIDSMYKRAKKELSTLDSDSLFENSGSTKKTKLNLAVETFAAVFAWKKAKAKAEKEAAKAKEEATEKLAILKEIKGKKELGAIEAMSLEDIEKEIAKYE